MATSSFRFSLIPALACLALLAQMASAAPPGPQAARIADYWTPERRASAIPRDLVIDNRGLGYLRRPNGALEPYGHSVAAARPQLRATTPKTAPVPRGKPGGSDTTAPVITGIPRRRCHHRQ